MKKIRALIIEDSHDTTVLLVKQLEEGGYTVDFTRVDTSERLKEELDNGPWDIVISDYVMPGFTGLDALKIVKEHPAEPRPPFIIISGTIDEATAVEAMLAGARDFVTKQNLKRLLPAMDRELEESAIRKKKSEAEALLEENRDRYEHLFQHAADYILVLELNENGPPTIIDANDDAFTKHGYSREELIGEPISLLDTDSPAKSIQETIPKLETGQTLTFEIERRCKDGSTFIAEACVKAIVMDSRHILLSIERDITDRKRTEREMLDSKEQLEKEVALRTAELKEERDRANEYLDIAASIFVAIDTEGIVTLINKSGAEVLGYRIDEIVGKNWFENFLPKDIVAEVVPVAEQLLSGDAKAVEFHENLIVTKSGEERLIAWHNTVLRSKDGEIIGHLSSGTDITERNKAEEILTKERERLYAILDTFPGFVYLQAEDKSIRFANKRFIEHYGDPTGKKCYELIWDREKPCDQCPTFEVFKSREAISWVSEDPKQDRIYQVYGYPFVDIDGIFLVLEMCIDITGQKQIEKETIKKSALLDALSKAQSSFISDTDPLHLFDELLGALLKLTESEYGFIGQILYKDDGTPYLKNFATTDISWDEPTRQFYEDNAPEGLEFFNLKTLFGSVITSGEPVIANDPVSDPRRCGIPEGHPPLNAFLGLPFHSGDRLVGMIAIANRPGGYDEEVVRFLDPFLSTCNNIINSYQNDQRKKALEKEYHDSQSLLSSILDNSTTVIYAKDMDGRYLLVNSIFEKLFNISKEKIIGKTDIDIFPEDIAIRFHANDLEVLRAGKAVEFEEEVPNENGLHTYISVKFPLRDTNGEAYATCGISTDITDRIKADKSIHEQARLMDLIFEHSIDGIVLLDKDFNFIRVSEAYANSCKIDVSKFIGRNHFEVFPSNLKEEIKPFVEKKEIYRRQDRPFLFPDHPEWGITYWDLGLVPILGEDGEIELFLFTLKDTTKRVKADEELARSRESLEAAQKVARIGNWDWNIEENTLYWSDEIYRIYGLPKSDFEASYEAFLKFVHPEDRPLIVKAVDQALHDNKPYHIDHRIVLKNGTERIVHQDGEVTFGKNDTPVRMVGTVQDITDSRRAQEELRMLSTAIQQSINAIFITDPTGKIEYVNPPFEILTGYSKEEVLGETPSILSSGDTLEHDYKELWDNILAGRTWSGEFKNKTKHGIIYWCSCVITPILDTTGKITNFLAVQENITEKKKAEERAEYLSSFDELTGLINRQRFTRLLDETLRYSQSRGHDTIVMIINIDRFRPINDTYGHNAGDIIIKKVADEIQSAVADYDKEAATASRIRESITGRMGSDEFAIFAPSISAEEGEAMAEMVQRRFENFRTPEVPVNITVSIGGAVSPRDGLSSKSLLTKADAALLRAKRHGGNNYRLYRAEDQDLEKMHSRLKDKERIERALEDDLFLPWFQPILCIADNKVHHYEALARLRGPEGSILPPGAFIDTAEEFGIVNLIDRSIIEQTIIMQAEETKAGNDVTFAMNLSGKDLEDMTLIDFIKEKILETGADPQKLSFEITETAAIKELSIAKNFISSLRELGCKFALDDFGVGFTSFVYLKELQVDYIKIDGYFIRKLEDDVSDQLFVKAIIDVARGLGIKTVAEFVENENILTVLRKFGVDYAQGYHIGKPAPNLLDR